MVDEDERADPVWVIGRSEAGREDLGLPGTLTPLRDLDSDEAERLFEAIALFRSFGADWLHHSVVAASHRIGQAVQASDPEAFDYDAVRWLVRQFVGAAVARLDMPEPGPATIEAINVAMSSAPGVVLGELVRSLWELQVVEVEGRHAVEIVFADDKRVPLAAWMTKLGSQLTAISDGELLDAEDAMVDGAMRFAACHAMVGWGLVGIALRTDLNGHAGSEIKLRSLPFDLVDPLMGSLRIARARRDGLLAAIVDNAYPDPAAPVATAAERAVAEGPGVVTDPDRDDGADEPVTGPTEAASSVVDLGGFLREVTARSTLMEARWSDALNETRGDDIDVVMGQVGAVASAVMAQIQLDEANVEPVRLPGLPLQPATANGLVIDAQDRTRLEQRALATTLAFEDLTRAFGVLRSPTAGIADPVNGTIRSFWSQHGFTRVNLLSRQLVRVVSDRTLTDRTHAEAMASLAIEAWALGLPEAAVSYLLGAIEPAVEVAGPLAGAYATLRSCGEALGAGRRVGLDVLVPIVRFWTDELRRRHASGTVPGRGEPEPGADV